MKRKNFRLMKAFGMTALTGLLALAAGCVDNSKLKAQHKQIVEQATQIEDRAYRCAPAELAKARAHADFGKTELGDGNGKRGESHIHFADEMIKEADAISLNPLCHDTLRADRDKDGVFDDVDKCPDLPGIKDFNGCPDPDKDKDKVCAAWVSEMGLLADFSCQGIDSCPEEAGELAYNGCSNPDPDLDTICSPWVTEVGLQDKFNNCGGSDDCPEIAGLPEFNGCPNPDSDGDSVCDPWVGEKNLMGKFQCQGADKCPFERGKVDNDGCPEARKYIVVTQDRIELKEQFFFATNKTKVLKQSQGLLDEVAAVLNENPNIYIRVEGHTDASGKRKNNVKLSQGRAKSVVAELRKRGVDKSRMTSQGFGPDKPIDTNDTPEGRANNRRVEIHITKR